MPTAPDIPWIVTISPKPTPAGPLPAALEEVWSRFSITHRRDGTGDREDWVEQAVRLDVACRILPRAVLTTDLRTYVDLHTRELVDLPVDVVDSAPRWGVVPAHTGERDPADDYMPPAVFHATAGRRTTLCGFAPVSGADIRSVLAGFAADGIDRAIIKTRQPKGGIWRVDLTGDIDQALADTMDWSLIRLEGASDTLLAQEIIPMLYEYRLFVVNGAVITGAGAIEMHTPVFNRAPFDPAMQRVRAADTHVEDRPDLVDRFRAFGADVVQRWSREQPHVREYVLDVALGADDQPLVIERNALPNAGLYASDPYAVLRALHASC